MEMFLSLLMKNIGMRFLESFTFKALGFAFILIEKIFESEYDAFIPSTKESIRFVFFTKSPTKYRNILIL